MIPRLKPTLGWSEFKAAFTLAKSDDIENFESDFAQVMRQKYALAFPYGRTGLMILLEALGLKNKEIICPAYTCVVVPHAILQSGNKPVFIDCAEGKFNMDLIQAEEAINENTGAIIATSLFGFPVDLDQLEKIRKKHNSVFIIQDCAHSFSAEWKGRQVQKEGIAALFGLNISKMVTSVFGGMVTTDDQKLFRQLKAIRDSRLKKPDKFKSFKRFVYLMLVYPAFWEPIYTLTNKLDRSGSLGTLTRYYDESAITMPKDYLTQITALEGRVGRANLKRYDEILYHRRQAADFYYDTLKKIPNFILPQKKNGSTFSHFPVLLKDRDKYIVKALNLNIQLGTVVEYSIPEMPIYGGHSPKCFPRAATLARRVVNLPVCGGISMAKKTVSKIF